MNKLSKKVLISILTWIMIFITLGTSTFAWFSMNYTATATELNIVVKSNSTFLLIGDNPGIAVNKNGLTKTCAAAYISGGDEDRKIYPAFYGDGSVLGTNPANQITTIPGHWYTANNKNLNSSNDDVFNVNEIISANERLYMLTYKVYITFSADSIPYEKTLTINYERVSGDNSIAAVIVLNTTTDGNPTTEKFQLDVNNTTATTVGNVYISKDTAYEITILAYINGNGQNVYSDYFELHGLDGEFNLEFSIIQ